MRSSGGEAATARVVLAAAEGHTLAEPQYRKFVRPTSARTGASAAPHPSILGWPTGLRFDRIDKATRLARRPNRSAEPPPGDAGAAFRRMKLSEDWNWTQRTLGPPGAEERHVSPCPKASPASPSSTF